MQDRGVQVVDADAIDRGLEADFVGLAVMRAGFDAAAGKPGGERVGIVVSRLAFAGLRDRQPAELAGADDQRAFEFNWPRCFPDRSTAAAIG